MTFSLVPFSLCNCVYSYGEFLVLGIFRLKKNVKLKRSNFCNIKEKIRSEYWNVSFAFYSATTITFFCGIMDLFSLLQIIIILGTVLHFPSLLKKMRQVNHPKFILIWQLTKIYYLKDQNMDHITLQNKFGEVLFELWTESDSRMKRVNEYSVLYSSYLF